MQLKEAIEKRSSVRSFTDEEIPVEVLKEMVRLAGLAPSVNNAQPWHFIAISNKDILKCMANAVKSKLSDIVSSDNSDEVSKAKSQVEWFSTFFADSPVVMAVVSKPYEAVLDKAINHDAIKHEDINLMRGCPDIQSIGAAVENLLLAAVDMGYGGCWLSGPMIAREDIENCLKIKVPNKLAAMVAIGKPAVDAKQREKKSVEEIFEVFA